MRIFIVTLLLATPLLCSAQTYKWVDDKGQTGYSDDLGKVPSKYRENAVVEEKQGQAVEVIENGETDNDPQKGAEVKSEQKKDAKGQDKDKDKRTYTYDGKTGEAWKKDFASQIFQIRSLEEQLSGIKERMADAGKISRGEYLALQNTERDLEVRLEKAKQKLAALNEAADKAEVPAEFR